AEGFSKNLIENLPKLDIEYATKEVGKLTEPAHNLTSQATESIKNAGAELSRNGQELLEGANRGTNDALDKLKSIFSPTKIEVKSQLNEDTKISKAPSTSSSKTLSKTDSNTEKTSISDSDNLSTHSNSDSNISQNSSIFSKAKTLLGFSKKSSIRLDSSSDISAPLSRAPSSAESVESSSSKSSLSSAFSRVKSGFGKLKSSSSSISSSSSFSRSSSSSSSISSSSSSSRSSSRSSSSSSKTGNLENTEKSPSLFSRGYKRFSDFKNNIDSSFLWVKNIDKGGNVNFEAQIPLRCPSLNLSGKLDSLRKKMQQKSRSFYRTSDEAYSNLSEILSSSGSNSYSSNTSKSSWNISSSLSRARSGIESFGNFISENSGSSSMSETIRENWRTIKEYMPEKSHYSGSVSYSTNIDMSELSRKGSNALRSASNGISSMRDRFRSSSWSAGIGFNR
ncbi:MAG: hypothetical protein ACO26G_05635, partial [Rickettsiales bacterium]